MTAREKIRGELEELFGPESSAMATAASTTSGSKRSHRPEDERWVWFFQPESDPEFVSVSLMRSAVSPTSTPTATTTTTTTTTTTSTSSAPLPFALTLEVPSAYPKAVEECISVSSDHRHLSTLVDELLDFIYGEEPRKLTVTKLVSKIMSFHSKMNPQKKSKTSEPEMETSGGEGGGSAPQPRLTQAATTSSSKSVSASHKFDSMDMDTDMDTDRQGDDGGDDEDGEGGDGGGDDDFFDESVLWGNEEKGKVKEEPEDMFGVEEKWLDAHYEKKRWIDATRARYFQQGEDDIRKEAEKKLVLGGLAPAEPTPTGTAPTGTTVAAGTTPQTATPAAAQLQNHSKALEERLEVYRRDFEFSLGSLCNELTSIIRDSEEGKLNFQAEPINDDIFRWRIKLKNFSNQEAPIFAQLLEVERRFGYKYVELEITFKPALYPFYPPMVFLLRPRFEAFFLARIASLDSLRLPNWNPTWEVRHIVEMIESLLEKNGNIEVDAAENNLKDYPLGAHCALENLLFQLGLETNVEPRANLKYQVKPSQKHEYSPQILATLPTTSAPKPTPAPSTAITVTTQPASKPTQNEGTGTGTVNPEGQESAMNLLHLSTSPQQQNPTTEPKAAPKTFWAKGTGYGFGSRKTGVEWNPEKWEAAQREKNRQMNTILVEISNNLDDPTPLSKSQTLSVEESCLIPFLETHLRNDSLLDIVKHSELYSTLFSILRKFCQHPELVPLLHRLPHQKVSLASLISKMANAIRPFVEFSKASPGNQDLELKISQEILTLDELIRTNLQGVAPLSFDEKEPLMESKESTESKDQQYIKAMQELQFSEVDKFESHHYKKSASGPSSAFSVGRRILLETSTWASGSLPLSPSSSVFLRKLEGDMTLLQALITGPQGTPYSGGCFIFDICFPPDYPSSPPKVNMQTTGNGQVRFNPNLYNCGKVCLSLLGTWSGEVGENWNSKTSTLLQVLVSIQSLIMVEQPFFNEPGFERTMGTREGDTNNFAYNAYVRLGTVKHAMLDALRRPSKPFEAVIKKHFLLQRDAIKEQCRQWLADAENYLPPLSGYITAYTKSEYVSSLTKEVQSLELELDKLQLLDE